MSKHEALNDVSGPLPMRANFILKTTLNTTRRLLRQSLAGLATRLAPNPRIASIDRGIGLLPGDRHYRAYVGPPEDFDLLGGLQFSLLFSLGLREAHHLADLGCGSLRAGKLLIPYLQPGRYFGIEPNRWLVEEAIDRELGREMIRKKRPSFLHVDDFLLTSFGVEFDFVLAQSVFSHTYPDLLAKGLEAAAKVLAPQGMLVATFVDGENSDEGRGWRYPECVAYSWPQVAEQAERCGLWAGLLDWPHPRQQWFLAGRSEGVANLDALRRRIRSPYVTSRSGTLP